MRGKIIVLEGLDGSGKTVQFKLLYEKLETLGIKVATADFPDYSTFYGQLVARYLNKEFGDVYEVSPYISTLLYAGNRKEAAPKLWELLTQGYIILVNRYVGANLAYHSVKLPPEERPGFIEWVKELEYGGSQPIPREDLVIYFNLDVATAQTMVDRKEARSYTEQKRDIHERNSDYLGEVAQMYLWLCQNETNWTRLDVIDPATGQMDPPVEIHRRVMALLRNRKVLEG